MAQGTTSTAQTLVHTIHSALQAVEQQIRQHAYLQALDEARIAPARLGCFVAEQCCIIPGDLRSIALLISRCDQPASQQFFRDVLQGEAAALAALEPFGELCRLGSQLRPYGAGVTAALWLVSSRSAILHTVRGSTV
jgi:hypothetical protein